MCSSSILTAVVCMCVLQLRNTENLLELASGDYTQFKKDINDKLKELATSEELNMDADTSSPQFEADLKSKLDDVIKEHQNALKHL